MRQDFRLNRSRADMWRKQLQGLKGRLETLQGWHPGTSEGVPYISLQVISWAAFYSYMMNTQRWPRGAAPLLHPPCRNCLQSDQGTEGELDLKKSFLLNDSSLLSYQCFSLRHKGEDVCRADHHHLCVLPSSRLSSLPGRPLSLSFLLPAAQSSFWFISRTTWVLTGHFYRHLSALAGATSEEEADWAGGEAGCWWEGGLQRRGRPCTPGRGASCQIKRNHKYEREEKTLISYVGEGGEKVGHQSWISRLMTMNALHIYAMHINIWKTSTPVWTFKPFCPTCESFTNIAL